MIDKDIYTIRISQASTAQLMVITIELGIAFIGEAINTLDKDIEQYYALIDKAKNAVMQLVKGLDFSIPLAQDFYDIYLYQYELLTKAFFSKDIEPAKEAQELFETLLVGWQEAAKVEAAAAPVIEENAPQVYAGLTYQRDGLAEYVVQDESRGFQA